MLLLLTSSVTEKTYLKSKLLLIKYFCFVLEGDIPSASEHKMLSQQLYRLSPIVQLTNKIEGKLKVTINSLVPSDKCDLRVMFTP